MPPEQTDHLNYPERIEQTFTFTIPARQKAERLDAFITHSIEHATRTRVQKAIDRGAVTVNGAPSKANYKIRPGDVINVVVHKPPPMQLIPENIPLDVLFEDEHLIVVNKPAGMPVHPGIGNRIGTLVNAVLWHAGNREPIDVLGNRESLADAEDEEQDLAEAEGEEAEGEGEGEGEGAEVSSDLADEDDGLRSNAMRPGIVHRLDKDTSGVMVVGKTYEATLGLSEQFASRTVARQYVALAWGVIRDNDRLIESQFGRSTRDRKLHAVLDRGGKYAATEVHVLERYDCATLITCKLRTGRTHQIRVHLTHIKHPLVGDPEYGGRDTALNGVHHLFRRRAQLALGHMHRQALHARSLEFTHPVTRERLTFTSSVPADFLAAVQELRPPEAGPLPPCLH
jgi:23S rRNA pseudouridine1911/1915/1917 synthase